MRKLLLCVAMLLAFSATALPTCWDLGLPSGTIVNFNGNGVFDQAGVTHFRGVIFDTKGIPTGLEVGTELFGVALMDEIDAVGSGDVLWTLPAGKEMTLSFWDATVVSSSVAFENSLIRIIDTVYSDNAKIVLVQEDAYDYNTVPGPGAFDLVNGYYPTVYEAADPNEAVFLALSLSDNESVLTWDKVHNKLLSASFDSVDVSIVGGCGVDQFENVIKAHGDTFTLNLGPTDWLYNADVDIQFNTVPAPTALISLFSGLALLGGYRLRRRS